VCRSLGGKGEVFFFDVQEKRKNRNVICCFVGIDFNIHLYERVGKLQLICFMEFKLNIEYNELLALITLNEKHFARIPGLELITKP